MVIGGNVEEQIASNLKTGRDKTMRTLWNFR
jgi:hypothetical protein